jgi:putative transposase
MTHNSDKHHRRSTRLKVYDYSQTGAYFVTICTKDRECLFGDIVDGEMRLNEYGTIVANRWDAIPNYIANVERDEFVVMPNHIHGIIVIRSDCVGAIHELPLRDETPNETRKYRRQMLLPKIIGRFKMNTAKIINQIRNRPGYPIWQRNYYEHVIRNDDDLNRIRQYIIENPMKWYEDKDNPANIIHRRGNS